MDLTTTAQTVSTAATAFSWWHLIGAFIVGLLGAPAVQKVLAGKAQVVAEAAKTLAPAAETVAVLAGQPALASGIEATNKVIQAVASTQDPNQLAALAIVHAQALASAAPATAPAA